MRAAACARMVGAALLCGCGARTSLSDLEPAATGPSGSSCDVGALAVTEETDIAPTFDTNDFPSIAFDASERPAVLYEQYASGFAGSIARRLSASKWSTTRLPQRIATGAMASGAPGPLEIAGYDGAGHAFLLVESGDGFTTAPMPIHDAIRSTNAWRDARGALHMVTVQSTESTVTHVAYDGGFTLTPLERDGVHPRLTLDGKGVPWIAWFVPTDASTAALHVWRGDTGSIETVTSAKSAGLYAIVADDRPLVATSEDRRAAIVMHARGDDGVWTRTELPADGIATCVFEADFECNGVALVPICGGTSVLYARSSDGAAQLVLAAPGGASTVLLTHPGSTIRSVRAIVDAEGRIHVVYDESGTARYALIGPRP